MAIIPPKQFNFVITYLNTTKINIRFKILPSIFLYGIILITVAWIAGKIKQAKYYESLNER